MKAFATFITLLILVSSASFAQDYSTKNKKAIAAYEEGLVKYQYRSFAESERALVKALNIDPKFEEAYYLLAGVYTALNDVDKVILTLQRCVQMTVDTNPWSLYKLAFEQVENGLFKEALVNLQILKTKAEALSPKKIKEMESLTSNCEQAIELMKNPVSFTPKNMGPNINSQFDDYHPGMTVDDNIIILTSNIPHPQVRGNQEDLFYSTRTETDWTLRKPLGETINKKTNEGAQSISADAKKMFFTVCNAPDSYGSCDIYSTMIKNGRWTTPKNLGPIVNSNGWDSQPSLTADGRTLYFVSNRAGGLGNKDIWKSTLNSNDEWTQPINIGAPINTPEEDEAPFIHADGRTLYFSTDGHGGMGKKDIFFSHLQDDKTWSEPENIGYPINTHQKESRIIVNASGDKAYFASNRYGTLGGMDIFEFDMPESAKPHKVTYVTGIVFDAVSKKKLESLISIKELDTGELLYTMTSDNMSGEFLIPFVEGVEYAMEIASKGYLFYSENITLESVKSKITAPLEPLMVGKAVVLKNVFFDVDSDILKEASKTELLTIVEFMKQNPTIHFEVGGHTDNTGTKAHNIELSTKRAKAVRTFITSYGIDENRLSYKGYADNKPVVANTNDINRAKNRRTELIITKQ